MRNVPLDIIRRDKRFRASEHVRIYYGAEFCQRLIPEINSLVEDYNTSVWQGLKFTFVTPPVTDSGLKKLEPSFAFLAKQKDRIEIVVNDWGVLRLLSQDYSDLKPVFGRLMNKMLRDPRVSPRYKTENIPEEPLSVLRECGISSLYYHQFLRTFGIDRIELDNLYQGIGIDFKAIGFKPSLYIPFGYVTTGRLCLFGALNQPKEKKFTCNIDCQKECQRYCAAMTNFPCQIGVKTLLQYGNSVFYQQDEAMIESALIWAEEYEARIVYQFNPFEKISYGTEDIRLAKGWIKGNYVLQEKTEIGI